MEVYNFKAIIKNEIFYSYDSHWGVYSFTTNDEIPHVSTKKVTNPFDSMFQDSPEGILAGQVQHLEIGTQYEVRAELKKTAKFGWQYVPLQVTMQKPTSEEEQEIFLQSMCTKTEAKKIIGAYPTFINDVLDGKTDFNVNVKHEKFKDIINKIQENYLLSDIFVLLTPLGITYNVIQRITDNVTNPQLLKDMLYKNPYILTRVHGLGFKKIDQLALKINPELKASEFRARAMITYVLKEASFGDGHTILPMSDIKAKLNEMVPESRAFFQKIFDDEAKNPESFFIQNGMIGLYGHYKSESIIYNKIIELSKNKMKIEVNTENAIKRAEKKFDIEFTDEQSNAIRSTLESNFIVITGAAGTGKSTVVSGILELYKTKKIGICALAAKAAQRVYEITGHPSETIHKMLEWQRDGFKRNQINPLTYEVVIMDEASMVNLNLFKALLNAIRNRTKLIIVFDHAQLPPIGAGNVATDILKLANININKFTKIHRQAQKSGILMDANKIRKGISPLPALQNGTTGELADMHYRFFDNKIEIQQLIIKAFFKAVEKSSMDSVIVIVPRKKNVANSTTKINSAIQDILFDEYVPMVKAGKKIFYLGDKVIQKVNNYNKNVVNGEIGYVTEIKGKDFEVTYYGKKIIEYETKEIKDMELAYALTVHSYQGSQSDIVIIGIDFSHYILLDNCLLYTAVTRASKECLIIAEKKAFQFAVRNNKNRDRKTFLKKIIANEIKPYNN